MFFSTPLPAKLGRACPFAPELHPLDVGLMLISSALASKLMQRPWRKDGSRVVAISGREWVVAPCWGVAWLPSVPVLQAPMVLHPPSALSAVLEPWERPWMWVRLGAGYCCDAGSGGWEPVARLCCCSACPGELGFLSACLEGDLVVCIKLALNQEEDVKLSWLQSWILNLYHLQQLGPDQFLISTVWYGIFGFSKSGIIKSAFWLIQQDTKKLDFLNWNQWKCVNLRSQDIAIIIHTHEHSVGTRPTDLIIVTVLEVWIAELESFKLHFQMILMQIARGATQIIEQDVPSMFISTRFCWSDDKYGVDTVPVVRVDPSEVDDNTSVVVPQIQQRGPLSLSSVKDIQNL